MKRNLKAMTPHMGTFGAGTATEACSARQQPPKWGRKNCEKNCDELQRIAFPRSVTEPATCKCQRAVSRPVEVIIMCKRPPHCKLAASHPESDPRVAKNKLQLRSLIRAQCMSSAAAPMSAFAPGCRVSPRGNHSTAALAFG